MEIMPKYGNIPKLLHQYPRETPVLVKPTRIDLYSKRWQWLEVLL